MVWFKSDDSFWRHPKVRKLGRDRLPAVGLWELAGTWCADNITTNVADGFVPNVQVEQWDPKHRYAKRLVEVILWEPAEVDGEHGYLFHDWPDYNPTRVEVATEREEWRKKKAAQRKSRRTSPGASPEDTDRDSNGESPEIPGTRSRSRPLDGGHLGEGGSPTARAESNDPPPPRCPEHAEQPAPGPCGNCADARRAREAWNAEQDQAKRDLTRELGAARRNPNLRCEHGTDGGQHIRSDTGQPLCALCRADNARDTA